MPAYQYKVLNREGKRETGVIASASEREAIASLEQKGFTVLALSLKREKAAAIKKRLKIKQRSLIAFSRQFATIIKAGVPILEGLKILSQQTDSPVLSEVINNIAKDIEGGFSLSQALERYPTIFSELYVNTVVAGEASGALDKILEELSFMMERDENIASEVKGALRYPLMTVIAIVAASLFLVTMVVPKFASIYSRLGSALPLPTQILISTSNFVIHYWYLAILLSVGAWYGFNKIINTKKGRIVWDTIKIKTPLFGELFIKMYMLRFTSMLSLLYDSGVPILKTLGIVSTTVGNKIVSKEVELMSKSVTEGKGLSSLLVKSKVFPPLVSNMMAIGERTGALSSMLRFVGDYYELDIKAMVKNLTSLIEPIMTVALGSVVLGMALAIFLPMWNMISALRKAG